MISLIILNWKRPDNIKNHILPYLENNILIDEIIISHGRKDTVFDYNSKNKNIIHRDDSKLNEKFGLSLRFLSALTCQNKIIMFMDDDEIISNEDIQNCYRTLTQNNIGIIGKYGRTLYKENNVYIYNFHNTYGESDIILTKFMLLKKNLIYDFFYNSILVEQLQLNAKPFWNGEDIFISLLSRKRYGKKSLYANRNIRGKKLNELGVSISLWSGHKNFRQFFYNECIKILNIR